MQQIIPTESISERYIILYIREQNILNRILLVWFMWLVWEFGSCRSGIAIVASWLVFQFREKFHTWLHSLTLCCFSQRRVRFPASTATTRDRRSRWKRKVWFRCVTLPGLLSNVWLQAWFIELFMSVTGGLASVTLPYCLQVARVALLGCKQWEEAFGL